MRARGAAGAVRSVDDRSGHGSSDQPARCRASGKCRTDVAQGVAVVNLRYQPADHAADILQSRPVGSRHGTGGVAIGNVGKIGLPYQSAQIIARSLNSAGCVGVTEHTGCRGTKVTHKPASHGPSGTGDSNCARCKYIRQRTPVSGTADETSCIAGTGNCCGAIRVIDGSRRLMRPQQAANACAAGNAASAVGVVDR